MRRLRARGWGLRAPRVALGGPGVHPGAAGLGLGGA